jgi:hypothetical protein
MPVNHPESVAEPPTLCGEPCPQCGFTSAFNDAINQLLGSWRTAEVHPQCVSAADLAVAFCADVQALPALAGERLRSAWVKEVYSLFCWSRGAVAPPPFKDFAAALAGLMRRGRAEEWRRGRRLTYTYYEVPAANVVQLAATERKRA